MPSLIYIFIRNVLEADSLRQAEDVKAFRAGQKTHSGLDLSQQKHVVSLALFILSYFLQINFLSKKKKLIIIMQLLIRTKT